MARDVFSEPFTPIDYTLDDDQSIARAELAYPAGKQVEPEFTPVSGAYGPGFVRRGEVDNIPELAIKARQRIVEAYNAMPPSQPLV